MDKPVMNGTSCNQTWNVGILIIDTSVRDYDNLRSILNSLDCLIDNSIQVFFHVFANSIDKGNFLGFEISLGSDFFQTGFVKHWA